MPCYNQQTIEVDIKGITDVEIWADALMEAGIASARFALSVARQSIERGTLGLQAPNQQAVNQAKRLYADKVIARVARRFGWQARKTGERRVQLARR